jgi:hypothetical protein
MNRPAFVRWSPEDHARFLAMLRSGTPMSDVATALSRTPRAIQLRRDAAMASEVGAGASHARVAKAFHVTADVVAAAVSAAASGSKATAASGTKPATIDDLVDRSTDVAELERVLRRVTARIAQLRPVDEPDDEDHVVVPRRFAFKNASA